MSNRTAAGAKTLPGKYYVSEEIYQLENERIFSKNWLYAGRVSRLKKPCSYFLNEIDNESIIVSKDDKNRLHAFFNVCRHRGTRLCTETEGQFSKSIQCPYHAWTYSLNGKLLSAPNMQEVNSFDISDYPLHRVALAEWEGGIFINLSEGAVSFENAYAALYEKFEQWQLSELIPVHRIEYDVNANWKLIFQNYSECYHCPNLHPVLNRLTPYRASSNDLEEGPFLGGPMHLSDGNESLTMSGRACAKPLAGISGDDLQLIYYYTIFPNMLLSLHPDYVLVHQLQRQGVGCTKIICEWLFHPDAVKQPDFDPSEAIEFWNMTNQQDWHICELAQKGVQSQAYVPGPYAELESMIAAFDRHYVKSLGNTIRE